MIKKTVWSPDTCDCKIEYEWNTDDSASSRKHTVSKILNVCEAHKDLADNATKFLSVLEENQRKNILYGKIVENIDSVTEEKTKSDGTTYRDLKTNCKFNWSFDKDRKLIVDLVGFTTTDKDTIETLIQNDNKLNGKVVIN